MMDGHPAGHGELAVDLGDKALDLVLELLVFAHAFAAWHQHLNVVDAGSQLRIARQGIVDRRQSLRHALGIIEPVHSQQNLAVLEGLPDL